MDYTKLRAAALASTEDEEAVTVDTRALIDKVLARYSGEWTTLRELIQNAADAAASTVKIKWETHPSTTVPLPSSATSTPSDLLKHTLTHHTLRRLLVTNDGQAFSSKDWARLKRIAEGNPDETKIGAFGVGFYSVFADCEEPFVSSGDQAIAFYWKGNALFTRRLQLPPGENKNGETTFVLDYRNATTALPNLLSVAQFLATSLTFVALRKIEFWIDDWRIVALEKKASPAANVPIPRTLQTKTHEGLMQIVSVERLSTQIDAMSISAVGWKPAVVSTTKGSAESSYALGGGEQISALKGFFSRFSSSGAAAAKAKKEEQAVQEAIAEDLLVGSRASIFLRVTSATIQTSVPKAFAGELERATKKPPPKTTRMSILTSTYDDALASESASDRGAGKAKTADIFASVLPSKKPGGRVFIGFPTTQTTGAGMHISAPSVIPTVEREAIDLNARWVKTWNIEMLRVAGIMTRMSFSNDMLELDDKIKRLASKDAKPSATDIAKYIPEALHIMKTYTFGDSTPSGHVGQIIQEAFWMAYRKATIEVYSSRGVLLTDKVRLRSEKLSKFVSDIPVIPKEMENNPFVSRLVDLGLIEDITVGDVTKELEAKSLNKDQLIHFVSWLAASSASGEIDPAGRQRLLDVAVATVGEGENDQGTIVALSTIQTFLSSNKIPHNLPLPPTTIPYALTAGIPQTHLQSLGWDALELVPWLTFLVDGAARGALPDEHNLTKSSVFAQQVLEVLSKNWDTLAPGSRTIIVNILTSRAIMPTKAGLRKPGESFFPTVKLFDDLPVVTGGQKLKEKFLLALGVRKTLDLETIFSRLLTKEAGDQKSNKPKWSHVELVKYLASVSDDIPKADMEKLRKSRICPAEAGPRGMESTVPSTMLYQVGELFEPLEALRALGLPILQWPGPPGSYRPSSPEARFLSALGLRPHPSVPELVEMMSRPDDDTVRNRAMTYFIANHHINGYARVDLSRSPVHFLPLQNNPKKRVAPSACYTNEQCSILDFDILKTELHVHANKFGVARDPPIIDCVNRLIASPPRTPDAARPIFDYFATRLAELGGNSLAKLRDAAIVPVVRRQANGEKGTNVTTHLRPQQCYLGTSATYGEIFDFVDFGTTANPFLFKCGSKAEPSKTEIAYLACTEPARLFSALASTEKYLNLLRSLAESMPVLKKDKELWRRMGAAPFLLGFREVTSTATKEKASEDDDDEVAPVKHYQLASAQHIVVLDDFIAYRLFKDNLLVAPEDDILEDFYAALGVPLLSSLVKEDIRVGAAGGEKPERAEAFRKHVVERAKIFLHEYSRNVMRDAVRHDAKWLDRYMKVEMVRTLALRRTLSRVSAQSHTQKRSAAMVNTKAGHVLYVSTEGTVDLFQVSQSLCGLLVTRPNHQAYLFLEQFLTLSLLDLKARGYNVDRILNAKKAEARVAEEERRKMLAQEQEERMAREALLEEQRAREQREGQMGVPNQPREIEPGNDFGTKGKMPGSFGDESPEDKPGAQPPAPLPIPVNTGERRGGRGLFSNIRRNLGLDSSSEDEKRNLLTDTKTPDHPHLDPQTPSPPENPNIHNHNHTHPQPSPTHPPQTGTAPTNTAVNADLSSAIRATRPHGSSTLFSPPTSTSVPAQTTYCDTTSAQDLTLVNRAPRNTPVYIDRASLSSPSEIDSFVTVQAPNIAAFERVLFEVAAVYAVPMSSVHIFWDRTGSTIAFNLSGSLFANLRYFNQLHAGSLMNGGGGREWTEAVVWWWVTFAHELAHNLEGAHGAQHSYYTESFVQQYFPKMMAQSAAYAAGYIPGQQTGVPEQPRPQQPSGPPPPYQAPYHLR